MDEFIHLPEFQVIICKTCRYAILPSKIDTHFAAKSHRLDKKRREKIIQEVAKVNGLIQNEEELSKCEFPFPAATSKPIAALRTPATDGLRCTKSVNGQQCPYVCRTERWMRKHSWEEHQWKSEGKGGRPQKQNPRSARKVPWQAGIHCQRFFKQGSKSRYFEVQPVETGPRPTPRMASRTGQFKAAKQEMQRAFEKAEEEEKRQTKETDEAKEPSPWLRRWRHSRRHLLKSRQYRRYKRNAGGRNGGWTAESTYPAAGLFQGQGVRGMSPAVQLMPLKPSMPVPIYSQRR